MKTFGGASPCALAGVGGAIGLAAALVPACRASALDPMTTLRTE